MTRLDLDPVIHQATRLRIMAALHRNREASFTGLRDGLGLTDGNLGSHVQRLEAAEYLESRRVLTPRGFEVRLRITSAGSRAFRAYVEALRDLLAEPGPASADVAPAAPPASAGAGGARRS